MTSQAPQAPASPSANRNVPSTAFAESLSADAFLSLGSMEGVYEPVVAAAAPAIPIPTAPALPKLAPGYILAAGVTILSYLIHKLPIAPFSIKGEGGLRHPISATIIAILVGLLFRNVLALPDSVKVGCKHIIKKIIPIAIVFTGAKLNLANIAAIGFPVFMVTILCILFAIGAAFYIGKLLKLNWKTSLLLGAGTGICGNSAIVAVAPLIEAEEDDLVLSIGAINLFGLLAMLIWPLIGTAIGISDQAFGVWSGTSIHAVPQVVAAGFAFSSEAGTLATLVKLVRVTMLAPMVFILAIVYAKHHQSANTPDKAFTVRYTRLVPWFVWGFVILALLNTMGLMPTLHFEPGSALVTASGGMDVSLQNIFSDIGKALLTLAMAAIGLEVCLRHLVSVGSRTIQAGLLATVALGAASLGLITIFL